MPRRTRTYMFVGILLVTLMMTVVPSTPISESVVATNESYTTANFESKHILFDESHCQNASSVWTPGNASLFSWLLGENGYTSDTNFDEPLDSGILSEYDILVIFFPQKAFTAGELTAIEAFVSGGGGLLLGGVNYGSTWGFVSSRMNPLSSTFDITFNNDIINNEADTFQTHNITHGVTSWWPNLDVLWGCSLDVTGSAESVIKLGSSDLVAVAEYGAGRVVCSGSTGPFVFHRYESYDHGDSHAQFSLNVIDWLSNNPARDAVIPEIARITVGQGPNLSPSEIEDYALFVGLYHDHTTHSDGGGLPQDMLDMGLARGLDFMIMTDHAHKNPTPIEGVTGAQAMKAIAEAYNLDIHITVGAELSSVLHTTGWPLTENIWTDNLQTGVDEIHAQGGIATFSHPGIAASYAEGLDNFESYGFDAIEVVNSNYFRGEGEFGFLYNFMGANDHHSLSGVGWTGTAVFVQNPTGPNGMVSDADLLDAVLNRRIVVLNTLSDMVYGEEIWVDRYLEILSEAETAVEDAHTIIDAVKSAGNDISLSEQYMDNADLALTYWNPARALKLAANATSDSALSIDISVTPPETLIPDTDFELSLDFTNNHTYPVSFDAAFYIAYSVDFGSISYPVEAAASSSTEVILDGHTDNFGLAKYYLFMSDFNTSEYLMPVMFRARNLIDNVTYSVEEVGGRYNIDISFYIGRDSSGLLRTVSLVYNDGTGETSIDMDKEWNEFIYSLEDYAGGTNISFYVEVETIYGDTFELNIQTVTLPSGGGGGLELSPTLLIIIGGVGVVVVVIVVIFVKKRGT